MRQRIEPCLFVDPQSLPPASWCESCGAEVYDPEQTLCTRCRRAAQKEEEDA